MSLDEQSNWLQHVPCDGSKYNRTTTVFGFAAVCCPNSQVWGVGGSNLYSNKTSNQNNINGNSGSKNYPKIKPNDQSLYGRPYYSNSPNYYGTQNDPQYQNSYNNQHINPVTRGYGSQNYYPSNQQAGSTDNYLNGDNQNTYRPGIYGGQSNLPNYHRRRPKQNLYGVQQNPDEFGNQNSYGNDQDTSINQSVPEYPETNGGSWNNQVPTDYQNIQGDETTPSSPNPYFQQNPNTYQSQPNNGENSNERGLNQYCTRIKSSFPPNPETGCCGKDASNMPRVTDLQYLLNMFAPSQPTTRHQPKATYPRGRNWPTPSYNNPSYFQKRRKRSAQKNATVDVTLEDRIAGGQETELDQFPWTVLMKTTFDYGSKIAAFSCGGSLISRRYVLTAGHCVYEPKAKVFLVIELILNFDQSEVEITLAEYDKRTFPDDCVMVFGGRQSCVKNVRMQAEDVIHHPEYNDDRLLNDIALIRLRGWAPYTMYIRPICLPPFSIDKADYSNLPLAVAGWGRNGKYETDIKQSTVVHLIPHDDCEKSYPHLTSSHICAAGRTGEDTCKGDSGGPLMMLYRGSYYVIGIVSGKRADSPCGSKVPSLYTNVY
ncbi:unnamed protein product, partial [Leptidea sinapis]